MSTTIKFSDAVFENGFASVPFTVEYYSQEHRAGVTITARTTVLGPRPDRVALTSLPAD